jgi:hypothetical protein
MMTRMCPRVRRKAEHHSMLESQPSRFMHNWGPNTCCLLVVVLVVVVALVVALVVL